MGKYEELINQELLLTEEGMAPMPAGPAGAAEAPIMGGDPGGMGDPAGGMPGMDQAPEDPTQDMENDAKRESDPMAYTEETLKMLVDPDEGISPEMFANFIDTFGVGLTKIRDKDGFKKFYNEFYEQLKSVVQMNSRLKSMYEQLHGTMQDVLSTQTEEPNTAGNEPAAKGPGV